MLALFDALVDITVAVLTTWIAGIALARLDTAVCSKVHRPRFLELVASPSFVLVKMLSGRVENTTIRYLDWLVLRKIRVKTWLFAHDISPSLLLDLVLATAGPHVRTLQLSNLKQDTSGIFAAVFLSCPSIRAVCIEKCHQWTGVQGIPAQNSLHTLMIKNCQSPRDAVFRRDAMLSLRRLVLVGHFTGKLHLSILASAPNMEESRANLSYLNAECHRSRHCKREYSSWARLFCMSPKLKRVQAWRHCWRAAPTSAHCRSTRRTITVMTWRAPSSRAAN